MARMYETWPYSRQELAKEKSVAKTEADHRFFDEIEQFFNFEDQRRQLLEDAAMRLAIATIDVANMRSQMPGGDYGQK